MISVRPFRAAYIAKPHGLTALAPFAESAGPLDIEIGCGVGWHPIRYARENPERRLVAIEHTETRFSRFARRLANHAPLPNLQAVQADAIHWVTHCLSAESVDRYFFLYPNPRARPWHVMPFFGRIIETLKPGGTVLLVTNERDYHHGARCYFEQAWDLETVSERYLTLASDPEIRPRTHFEKKYLARGETCFELLARKRLAEQGG